MNKTPAFLIEFLLTCITVQLSFVLFWMAELYELLGGQ